MHEVEINMFIVTHMQELDVWSESVGGLKSYFPSPPFPSIHLWHPAHPLSIWGWLLLPFLLLSLILYLPRSSDPWELFRSILSILWSSHLYRESKMVCVSLFIFLRYWIWIIAIKVSLNHSFGRSLQLFPHVSVIQGLLLVCARKISKLCEFAPSNRLTWLLSQWHYLFDLLFYIYKKKTFILIVFSKIVWKVERIE